MHVAVWIVVGVAVLALVALLLLTVSVMQRFGPLSRAQARLQKRVVRAQALATELQEMQKQSAAR